MFTLRSVISQATLDKQKAPRSLQELSAGYIKSIPKDPLTNETKWILGLSAFHHHSTVANFSINYFGSQLP